MKVFRSLTHAAVVLACVGMVVPRVAFAAGPAATKVSHDVALSASGSLSGIVVSSEGKPLDGAIISVRKNGKEVAKTVSDARGAFTVNGLHGGVYELAVGQQVVAVRAWMASAAPPAAQQQPVFVVGHATRGQSFLGLDPLTLAFGTSAIAALVLAAVNQADINDILDELDKKPNSP